MDSVAPSRYHGCSRKPRSGVLQTLALAHGFLAANDHGVGIMDDAVTDGVCQQRIGQLFRPARDVKLGTEDRGVSLVPGFHDFQ